MSPKQLAISTLHDLSRRCLHEQGELAAIEATEKDLLAAKAATLTRIKIIRKRIDRELLACGPMLGIEHLAQDAEDEDDERGAG